MADLLGEFFMSFGLLSVLALAGGLLSVRFKQPTVVALLLIGLVIDPSALGFIHNKETISVFAELGATLLLFSIGLEFSLPKIIGSGMRALLVSSGRIFLSFIIGYECGVLLGLGYIGSLALGACFSFSATAIFVRIVASHNLLSSKPVPLMISVLVIEDIAAVTVLAFFSALGSQTASGAAPGLIEILGSILFSIAILGFIYLVLQQVLGHAVRIFQLDKSREFMVLFSLGLCVILSIISVQIGLSPAIGAFLAGSTIAGLSIKHQVEDLVSPYSLAFTSFFFLSVGLMVAPSAVWAAWPMALALSLVFVTASFALVTLFVYLAGFELGDAVFSGASMAVMSEFALIIASYATRNLPASEGGFDLISTTILMVVFTTISSSILISQRGRIATFLRSAFVRYGHRRLGGIRHYVLSVLDEFEGQGSFLPRMKEASKGLFVSLAAFVALGIAFVLATRHLGGLQVELAGHAVGISAILLLLAIVPLAVVFFNLLRHLKLIADALTTVFVRIHPDGERVGRRIARDFIFLSLALTALIALPFAIDLMKLPGEFHLLGFLLAAAGFLLFYDAVTSFLSWHGRKLG